MRRLQALCVAASTLLSIAAGVSVTTAWTVTLPYPLSVQGQTSIVGNGNGTFFATDVNGTVWAIDETSHAVLWNLKWDNLMGLFVVEDVLLIALQEGTWAVNARTGRILWVNNTYGITPSSGSNPGLPYVSVGSVIAFYNSQASQVCSGQALMLTALNVRTGQQLWSQCAGGAGQAVPFLANGTLAVVSADPVSGTGFVYGYSFATGALKWRNALYLGSAAPGGFFAGGSANYLAFVNSTANHPGSYIIVLDPSTGVTQRKFYIDSSVQEAANTFVSGNYMYALATTDGSATGVEQSTVEKYDLSDGAVMWSRPIGGDGGGSGSGSNIPPSGSSSSGSGGLPPPPPSPPTVALTFTANGIFVAISSSAAGASQLANFTVLSTSGDVVVKINDAPQTAAATGYFVLNGAYVFLPNLQGYTLWSTSSGSLVARNYMLPGLGGAPPVTLPNGQLVFAGGNSVFALAITN